MKGLLRALGQVILAIAMTATVMGFFSFIVAMFSPYWPWHRLDGWIFLAIGFVGLLIWQGADHGIEAFGKVLVGALAVVIMRWAYLEIGVPQAWFVIAPVAAFTAYGYLRGFRRNRRKRVSAFAYIDYEDGVSGSPSQHT